jgi:hypothetical protein
MSKRAAEPISRRWLSCLGGTAIVLATIVPSGEDFEEPCQSENVEALAEVRQASRIPVVTGETLLTRAGFR